LSWIGKENDVESSLGDFGARKYDPELGRFTSVDPLWEEMPRLSSPFHYCFNNPIMMRDPFGLEPDGFMNQLTDLEWQCGGEQEEASPLKKGSEYSERVKKETIRANKIAWNLQMRDRDAADKAGAGWMTAALGQLGQSEYSGRSSNPAIIDYHKTTGNSTSDEIPWCSSFINWAVTQAGIRGTNSARAFSWLNWGYALEKPAYGAIAVMRYSHVGLVAGVNSDGRLVILGGNQGDPGTVSLRCNNLASIIA
jgi:uncharacterized protein (TIGR02594 family)